MLLNNVEITVAFKSVKVSLTDKSIYTFNYNYDDNSVQAVCRRYRYILNLRKSTYFNLKARPTRNNFNRKTM